MFKQAKWLFVLVHFVFVPILFAQTSSLQFEHITAEDGLPGTTIYSILQDREGYMWFGGPSGVYKYDGQKFTTYKNIPFNENSLSHNNVSSMIEDHEGFLWFGTVVGLNRFDPKRETFVLYQHDPTDDHSLQINGVKLLFEDSRNTLWVIYWEPDSRGIVMSVFEREKDTFEHIHHGQFFPNRSHIEGFRINVIYESKDGLIWFGTNDGLFSLNSETEKVVHYKPDNNAGITAIQEDDVGRIWVGLDFKGLNIFDRSSEHFQRVPISFYDEEQAVFLLGRVRSLYCDIDGFMWVSTQGAGVFRVDPASLEYEMFMPETGNKVSLMDDDIHKIYQDRGGLLWIGTQSKGLSTYDRKTSRFRNYLQSADSMSQGNMVVTSILEDEEDNIWAGTFSRGLHRVNLKRNVQSNIGLDNVWSLALSTDSSVWVGTSSGLRKIDNQKNQASRNFSFDTEGVSEMLARSVFITTLYSSPSGDFLVGTNGEGLFRIQNDAKKITQYNYDPIHEKAFPANSWVRALLQTEPDVLWIGIDSGGLNKMNLETGEIESFLHDPTNPLSLTNNAVRALYQEVTGILWVGTFGGGLNRFDPVTEQFTSYQVSDGLPSDLIGGIMPDMQGHLWLNTPRGLVQFDPESGNVTTYGLRDGLPSDELLSGATLVRDNGEMIVGTSNGFSIFDPLDFGIDYHVSPVVVTSMNVFEESVNWKKNISKTTPFTLNHNENFFSFEFAVLDFASPHKNQYQYKLEGVDQDWVYSGTRPYARYTEVSPGSYIFRVKGTGRNGVWAEAAPVHLRITPPIWQRWWFLSLSNLFLLGLVTAIYKYRLSLKNEVEKDRQRIADDLHDDMGSKISSVKIMLDWLINKGRIDGQEKSIISDLSITLSHLDRDLRDIIWIAQRKDGYEDLIPRMKEIAQNMLIGLEIEFIESEGSIRIPTNIELRREIYLIYKEVINNIIHHAQATCVHIVIRTDEKQLTWSVKDNGNGFDMSDYITGNGMRTIQSRAGKIGGNLKIESQPDKGTSVYFTLEY